MNSKQTIEEAEQATMRLVVRAINDFFSQAKEIFRQETDLPQDVDEDCTAEAMQILGASNLRHRLFGKIDYKKQFGCFFQTVNKQWLFSLIQRQKNPKAQEPLQFN